MDVPWRQRRLRLSRILFTGPGSSAAEGNDAEQRHGMALDKRAHSKDIEDLRFTNRDLDLVGTLANGQFGTVDVVRCKHDGEVYIRKTIEKKVALRFREQCSAQFERDLLLKARYANSAWAPHLLCAFQTPETLNLVMQYADGGTLWDVLESCTDGRLTEMDLRWWIPQAVSAIDWCHSQGFAHRDIKPHNFVLTSSAHLLLIDFGSSAPLLPASSSGAQQVPKPYCLLPCGTCDYISPEILQAHEEALVAAETGEEVVTSMDEGGYGRETDWWSLGAMMYELACGVAPFFAPEVRQTYMKIVNHEKSTIRFDESFRIPSDCKGLLRRFLTRFDRRLGRRSVDDIKAHPFFSSVKWSTLHLQPAPHALTLPHFTYSAAAQPAPPQADASADDPPGFSFSHLFNSSPALSALRASVNTGNSPVVNGSPAGADFLGFSWGPPLDAFDHVSSSAHTSSQTPSNHVRTPLQHPAVQSLRRPTPNTRASDPHPFTNAFVTPVRPSMLHYPTTVPRTAGATLRQTRMVSDREALRQLITCVSASARKKVLESGKKPRLPSINSLDVPIPGPNLLGKKRKSLPMIQINPSVSFDESAPPSPSPRPGSSLSKRSGSGFGFASATALRSTPSLVLVESISGADSDGGHVLMSDGMFDEMDGRLKSLMAELARIQKMLSQVPTTS